MRARALSTLLGTLLLLPTWSGTSRAAEFFADPNALPARPELPDPLVARNGGRITTERQWLRQRRAELKDLFEHYMYGHVPLAPPPFPPLVERVDQNFYGGKATKKEVTLALGPAGAPSLHLLVVIPNHRSKPVPAFVGIAFCGIYALINDPATPLPTGWMYPGPGVVNNRATEAGRGAQAETWAIEQTIDRGYAVAIFYNGDVEPDYSNAKEGVRRFYATLGKNYDWGAIAAWAWGARRALDYLMTEPAIDRQRIGVVGHSRNGKAALVAGAFEEHFALVIPLQAGCGGTAPSRGKVGETVKQINDHFPHWFNAEFKKFNDQPDHLPFDQHCLIALCAPRPVLLPNAQEDSWANPAGQFEMLQAADPVYRLLRVEGLEAAKMPDLDTLVASRLGYYIRPGKHSMTKGDWKVFLDFADRQFGAPAPASAGP